MLQNLISYPFLFNLFLPIVNPFPYLLLFMKFVLTGLVNSQQRFLNFLLGVIKNTFVFKPLNFVVHMAPNNAHEYTCDYRSNDNPSSRIRFFFDLFFKLANMDSLNIFQKNDNALDDDFGANHH